MKEVRDSNILESPKNPRFSNITQASIIDENEINLEEEPILVFCENCNAEVVAELGHKPNSKTAYASITIAMLGGLLGCFVAPFYINKCKESYIVCSRCKQRI